MLEEVERVNSVAWSPDGRQLVSGSYDGKIRLWNSNGTPGKTLERQGPWMPIAAVAWSADGHWIASAAGEIRLLRPDGTPGLTLGGWKNACWTDA